MTEGVMGTCICYEVILFKPMMDYLCFLPTTFVIY